MDVLGDKVLVEAKIQLGFFQKYGKTGQSSSFKINSKENSGMRNDSRRNYLLEQTNSKE